MLDGYWRHQSSQADCECQLDCACTSKMLQVEKQEERLHTISERSIVQGNGYQSPKNWGGGLRRPICRVRIWNECLFWRPHVNALHVLMYHCVCNSNILCLQSRWITSIFWFTSLPYHSVYAWKYGWIYHVLPSIPPSERPCWYFLPHRTSFRFK
jgi:hypothetical protein